MKNIKWTLNSYWLDNGDKRYLLYDVISINFITTIGAFLVEPVRREASQVLLEKIPRKNYYTGKK